MDEDKVNTGHNIEDRELIKNARKPVGELGHKILDRMNRSHENMAVWGVSHFDIAEDDVVLDIGCGGGVNIEKFLKLTKGNVDGLDYSEVSVEASLAQNRKAVDDGRCRIIQADVRQMPIGDEEYDLVSAFETIYFWPEIQESFREVSRVIRPGGQFMIAQGTDGNHPDDEMWLATVEGMHVYTAEDLKEYLLNAGFSRVESYVKENDYILVVIARK